MQIVTTPHPLEAAADHTAGVIRTQLLAGHQVLWLLSGGSSLTIATRAAQLLADTDLTRLSISLTDERYGPVGHADENWQRLLDSGFTAPGATLYRPLTGDPLTETVLHFNQWLTNTLASADYVLGMFGIGSDGHTAGIKPQSPALVSTELVAGYEAADFRRLTITPVALAHCDEAIVQASGDDKQAALTSWLQSALTPDEQPAQLLKTIPTLTLYTTNQLEES